MLQLAFDIGGTFTDIVLYDPSNGQTSIWKVPTTQHEHAKAVVDELNVRIAKKELAAGSVSTVFHATTVATNIILERNGQPTALVTTRGFRDIFLIGRQKRYDINNLHMRKPAPLIHRADVFEVTERLGPNGAVVTEFDEADARKVATELRERGYRSVAVVFLHAYASDAHERRMAKVLAEVAPDLEISLSSHISPKIREYERTSTTVANAYVKPVVGSYLTALEKSLGDIGIRAPLSIMQSNGGLVSPELARDYPIRIVESGPAAGVFMCADVGRDEGIDHLLTFDMGGTTAKLGAIDNGQPAIMPTFEVDAVNYTKGSGLPLNITAIELLEIGAGGGSIASANMGLISVGPQSAGADPGPICYQRGGTRPTITDANLVLGYLNPDFFNGGAMQLDVAGAADGIKRDISTPLGLSLENAAWGIHRIANANMERAMRIVSIDRGRDPRRYTMVAFGGAGPLHACRIASTIGIPRVIIPHGAGVGSALGLLSAEHKSDLAVTHILEMSDSNVDAITKLFEEIEQRVRAQALRHAQSRNIVVQRSVWMHYVGQGYEVRVDLPPGKIDAAYLAKAREAFYAEYKREYGYIDPESKIEGTEWYIAATPAPDGSRVSFKRPSGRAGEAIVGTRKAYFPEIGGLISCKIIDRYRMKAGEQFEGPALVEERESTTVVRPGDIVSVSAAGHLVIEIKKSAV